MNLPGLKLPWANRKADEDEAVTHERAAMARDIAQIKRLNEWLLNRALAEGALKEEAAQALRATESYDSEVTENVGTDPDHR